MILSEARQLLHQYVGPDGPDSVLVPQRINEVCERLFTCGRWKGMLVEVDLEAEQGFVTLPRRCESILGVTVANVPRVPFGRWYHFVPGGPGGYDRATHTGPDVVVDAGDNHPLCRDPVSESFTLRVKLANTSDTASGNFLVVKGVGPDGLTVTGPDGSEGLKISLDSESTVITQKFSYVTGVLKSLTLGAVRLYAIDDLSGVETEVGVYEPGETTIGYRRYRIERSGNSDSEAIRVLCKRRFIPVVSETDEIVPNNMGALKLGLLSLKYEDTNDLERATEYFNRALFLLNAELREQRGSQFNTLRVSPSGFGLSRITSIY